MSVENSVSFHTWQKCPLPKQDTSAFQMTDFFCEINKTCLVCTPSHKCTVSFGLCYICSLYPEEKYLSIGVLPLITVFKATWFLPECMENDPYFWGLVDELLTVQQRRIWGKSAVGAHPPPLKWIGGFLIKTCLRPVTSHLRHPLVVHPSKITWIRHCSLKCNICHLLNSALCFLSVALSNSPAIFLESWP